MLPIPTTTTGLGYEDADETSVHADWIECSVLFHDDAISKADVQDCFSEIDSFNKENIQQKTDDIWSELERRKRILGRCCPVSIKGNRITAANWHSFSAYSFCLLLSYSKSNREWEHNFCKDYQTQGMLFERVSTAALMHIFNNWEIIHTGWSKATHVNIKKQIQHIADDLGEEILEFPGPDDKDGGVDILCYRQFPDKRGNYPVIFVQCATGKNWTDKRCLNALRLWKSWIRFNAPNMLLRGFAVPFAFGDATFYQTQTRGDCLVLDRIRLFSQDEESKWLTNELSEELKSWVTQKLNTFSED